MAVWIMQIFFSCDPVVSSEFPFGVLGGLGFFLFGGGVLLSGPFRSKVDQAAQLPFIQAELSLYGFSCTLLTFIRR